MYGLYYNPFFDSKKDEKPAKRLSLLGLRAYLYIGKT